MCMVKIQKECIVVCKRSTMIRQMRQKLRYSLFPILFDMAAVNLHISSSFANWKHALSWWQDLFNKQKVNPLNAELNPICHSLILLGDLTFMGTCIVSIFQYISNKTQRYTVYLYLETTLHVSGGTSTHHQERIQLYLQNLVFVKPLLLSPPTAHSNRFQHFHDSGR
jgi:hypothetical protein